MGKLLRFVPLYKENEKVGKKSRKGKASSELRFGFGSIHEEVKNQIKYLEKKLEKRKELLRMIEENDPLIQKFINLYRD